MNKHLMKAIAAASRAQGATCGYGFAGPLRVKHTQHGFQYFINHIEVGQAYADWFMEYVY